jgi:hypothetical protein
MIARLRNLIVAQRQLLKDVSHELRSPMARIQAAIGLANQQPEQAPALMERIQMESVRVDKLIGELLALSRLQAGVDNPLNEEIELRELLSDIVDDACFEANAKGRVIHVESEIDGVVRGNVALLRRALSKMWFVMPSNTAIAAGRWKWERRSVRTVESPSYRCETPGRAFLNPISPISSIRSFAVQRTRARREVA